MGSGQPEVANMFNLRQLTLPNILQRTVSKIHAQYREF